MGATRGPTQSTAIVLTGDEPRSGFDFTSIKSWALVHVPTGEVRRQADFAISTSSTAVSPDGAFLAAAGGGRVEIVELATGASRASGDAAVDTETGGFGLTYSSDGERLVSSDDSGRVTLWDGRTAAPLGTVKPADGTTSVAFLPDNQTVRIAAVDGAVYDWDTSVDHAVDTACRILVGRSMTEAEWSAVLPNQPYQPTCPED
jgi:WD40 repeat protein